MTHFNQLSPEEAERLALLAEECGEVIQVIGKILRHGYDSYNPTLENPPSNRFDLAKECGDVLFAIEFLTEAGDISRTGVQQFENAKRLKVAKYLHHAQI